MRSRPVSGQCARADECSVGPEADKCLLERAYLQGCVPGAGSAGDGSAAMPEAEAEAGAFACGRAELYSFALARLCVELQSTYKPRGGSTFQRVKFSCCARTEQRCGFSLLYVCTM